MENNPQIIIATSNQQLIPDPAGIWITREGENVPH
jgi:hypothetical protein